LIELTVIETSGLFLLILAVYTLTSYRFRQKKVENSGLILARIVAIIATAALVIWPVFYDSVFVEHFPDEATLPGPAFAMFFYLIFAASIWGTYALFRIIQNAVTKVRN
jgi:multisubunit Na+/H+ antiporter MnhB subunit